MSKILSATFVVFMFIAAMVAGCTKSNELAPLNSNAKTNGVSAATTTTTSTTGGHCGH